MTRPSYVRHLKIRSDKLRALLHEAWVLGNESYNTHSEPEGEVERRKQILDIMVREQFAEMVE